MAISVDAKELENEVKSLRETAQIGHAYATQLIEWFDSAGAAIDYL